MIQLREANIDELTSCEVDVLVCAPQPLWLQDTLDDQKLCVRVYQPIMAMVGDQRRVSADVGCCCSEQTHLSQQTMSDRYMPLKREYQNFQTVGVVRYRLFTLLDFFCCFCSSGSTKFLSCVAFVK
eukprot:1573550-Amphidinium_carterae.1